MYEELHTHFNGLKRYTFSQLHLLSNVSNGIYLLLEDGEKYKAMDRIVRVGSHPGTNRFFKRLNDHFFEKHRSSIVRKHIGRCYLNKENDPYLRVWSFNNKQVKKGSSGEQMIDQRKEEAIEQKVSRYLTNFSICIIPNLPEKETRMKLESKLIATLNQSGSQYISSDWLGRYHPDKRISESGLWNIQGLNGNEFISPDDLKLIKGKTKNEQA